jgi:hypothetical protein
MGEDSTTSTARILTPADCRGPKAVIPFLSTIMRDVLRPMIAILLVLSVARAEERPLLKAGYLPFSAKIGIASKMREAGLNAVWPKITSFSSSVDDDRSLPRLETWCETCATYELELWPVINFAGTANELEFVPDFRREVTLAGITQPHTPCPVDETYWRKVVFSRCVKLAELSRTRPSLRGVVLDLEMYGADHAGYVAPCACEACRRGAGSSKPAALLDWQRREVERIAHELQRAVHRVNEKFQFAAMHLEEPFPFHEGLALGLGTPDVPVIVAAERTYAAGYTPDVDATRERLKRIGTHVRYLGGLSLTHHPAEQVAPQLYALGSHGDGFWLYTLASLAAPTEQVAEAYRVPDPQAEYWSAFRLASDEMDRFVASRGQYVSPLIARRKPPEPRATLSKRVLEPISEQLPKLPLAGDETRLRRSNVAFVLLEQGETLRLSVQGVPISKQQTADGEVKVLDPDGREVLSRKVPLGQTAQIEWPVKISGTYWVTTSFGLNACELRVSNPRVVFFAGLHQRLKVFRQARPLFFVVPEECDAPITVLNESADAPARLRVCDSSGKVVLDEIVSESVSLKARGAPGVWSLTLDAHEGRPFGGVQVGLSPPLAPYLADAPERLLRDKR